MKKKEKLLFRKGQRDIGWLEGWCIIIIIMKDVGSFARQKYNLTASSLIAFNWTSRVNFNFALRVGST